MLHHHPDTQLLIDYAAGSLAFGQSLCLAVHLERCQACRSEVNGLTLVGAELVEQLQPVPPSAGLLDTVLERLDSDIAPEPQREADRAVGGVPRPLRKLIPGGMAALRWSRVTPSLQSVILRAGDVRHQVSLIRMRAGGRIPEHGHGGSELTVVLQGGFSDHTGSYRVGDFVALGAEHVHRPIAHQNEDCICLAAQDAPLQFTGFWSRLLNPFLSIEPA